RRFDSPRLRLLNLRVPIGVDAPDKGGNREERREQPQSQLDGLVHGTFPFEVMNRRGQKHSAAQKNAEAAGSSKAPVTALLQGAARAVPQAEAATGLAIFRRAPAGRPPDQSKTAATGPTAAACLSEEMRCRSNRAAAPFCDHRSRAARDRRL